MKKIFIVLLCVAAVAFSGCATTVRMIENASLQTRVVMTDPVFLSLTAKEKTAFIDVKNTSDLQGVMLAPVLRDRLIKKGLKLVDQPNDATWIIRANITSFTAQKADSAGQDFSIVGAIGGGLAGASLAGNNATVLPAALAGAVVGSIGGAALGTLVRIETATGVVDVLIQERAGGPVKTMTIAAIRQGTSTTETSHQSTETDRLPYRTQFRVSAKQTNMNIDKAVAEITNKLADQVAGLF